MVVVALVTLRAYALGKIYTARIGCAGWVRVCACIPCISAGGMMANATSVRLLENIAVTGCRNTFRPSVLGDFRRHVTMIPVEHDECCANSSLPDVVILASLHVGSAFHVVH